MAEKTFKEFVSGYDGSSELIYLTLADGTSYNCKVKGVMDDYFKVVLCSFNKEARAFEETANNFIIPFSAVVSIRLS
ncbi:MAG: hypothetical protein ACLFQK_01680 [Fibrobacterota bacterium]